MEWLRTRGTPEVVRFAGDEINFYVDVNAPRESMIAHLARNAVARSVLSD